VTKSNEGKLALGANPLIVSYNASVVEIYNATISLVRFFKQHHFLLL
jgi:hypothetical protein